MERLRTPFQGVGNIVRFNWHFYFLAVLFIASLLILNKATGNLYGLFVNLLCLLALIATSISLIVSYYVYDVSPLYSLPWLNNMQVKPGNTIVNIHAGFDETSVLLQLKYPGSKLVVLDFYDPVKHTETSIKRARKTYPAFPGTKSIITTDVKLPNNEADFVCLILAAHEIRNACERILFFKALRAIIKDGGKIIVTEHLRDMPNLLAYNIGFFHFLSRRSWYRTFKYSGFQIEQELKTTPFITTFILVKYGTAS